MRCNFQPFDALQTLVNHNLRNQTLLSLSAKSKHARILDRCSSDLKTEAIWGAKSSNSVIQLLCASKGRTRPLYLLIKHWASSTATSKGRHRPASSSPKFKEHTWIYLSEAKPYLSPCNKKVGIPLNIPIPCSSHPCNRRVTVVSLSWKGWKDKMELKERRDTLLSHPPFFQHLYSSTHTSLSMRFFSPSRCEDFIYRSDSEAVQWSHCTGRNKGVYIYIYMIFLFRLVVSKLFIMIL